MKRIIVCFLLLTVSVSCAQTRQDKEKVQAKAEQHFVEKNGYKQAYFASGCFWCSESIFESVIGVVKVIPGYSGGTGKNPTYENYSQKGHAEVAKVIYDPKVIDFQTLLTVYFGSQNPFQKNGQGPDTGSGYRSIIFYQNESEKKEAEEKVASIEKQYHRQVAAEIKKFTKFWRAEDYHQNFEQNNPNNPYIRNVSVPRINQFKNQYPELIKKSK